jgi:hypothetical protein
MSLSIAVIFVKIHNSIVKFLNVLLYRILYKSDNKLENRAKIFVEGQVKYGGLKCTDFHENCSCSTAIH